MEPIPLPSAETRRYGAGSKSLHRIDLAGALRSVVAVVTLAAIYVGTARAGLMLGAIAGFATLVWAPTGIALAALLLYGFRLWPAIFVGAFVANLWTGAPVLAALGIASGNTLEAVAGAF